MAAFSAAIFQRTPEALAARPISAPWPGRSDWPKSREPPARLTLGFLVSVHHDNYGITRKGMLLESVPLGVTTWTGPVVAPAGTVLLM
jgi:hypothetical protein